MPRHKTRVQTRWKDYDSFGHVNNAVFVTYLEVARTELLYELLGKERLTWEDVKFIIARVEVDYLMPIQPTRYVEVETWVSKIGQTSFEFSYALSAGETLLAKAKTVLVYFNYRLQKKMSIDDYFREQLLKWTD